MFLPDPPVHYACGIAARNRVNQLITIDGAELAHLERFFERVHDDDDVVALRVRVRAGTIQFLGSCGIYSAEVGYTEGD